MPALLKTGAHEYSDENNNKNTLVEATHPFVASNAKQLSFNKHERLKLLQMHDSGWWIVENEKGEVGLIPANYVRVYDRQLQESTPLRTTPVRLKVNRPAEWKPELVGNAKTDTQLMLEKLGLGSEEQHNEDEEELQEQHIDIIKPLQLQIELLEKQKNELLEQKRTAEKQADSESKQSQLMKRQNAILQKEISKLRTEKIGVENQLNEYLLSAQVVKTTMGATTVVSPKAHEPTLIVDNEKVRRLEQELNEINGILKTVLTERDTLEAASYSSREILKTQEQQHTEELTAINAKVQLLESVISKHRAANAEQEREFNERLQKIRRESDVGKENISRLRDIKKKQRILLQELSYFKKESVSKMMDMKKDFANLQKMGVNPLLAALTDITSKYMKELKVRKELYNELQELKGNIRVFVRVKPLGDQEQRNLVEIVENEVRVNDLDHKKMQTFDFEKIFSQYSTQLEVFEEVCPLATSVLDGYNVCIFAYGQTGSGKTYTMEGPDNDRGVNYRTLDQLFKIAKERKDEFTYEIRVSVIEIYNETIVDLLTPDKKKLELLLSNVVQIPNLTTAVVCSTDDVIKTLRGGYKNRAVGATNMNEHSSRSHCIVSVFVEGVNQRTNKLRWKGKLHLIDLAGSERLKKTESGGDRFKEGVAINKSLSALGDVIAALALKKPHVPYRNSKLTSLLQDSLGGNSKALMFVNISSAQANVSETLCSLQFASRVKQVELGKVEKNVFGPQPIEAKNFALKKVD